MTRERNLNFSQREGLSPLPIAYEQEELSYEVRNEIKYILMNWNTQKSLMSGSQQVHTLR